MDLNLLPWIGLTIGLLAVGGGGCYLWWRSPRRMASARIAADGVQVVEVLVRAGYHPATIRVRAGRPVRLLLRRDEDDPCSAGINLTEPPLRRRLPAFATTVIAFTPKKTGNHLFTCEEGRYRGHLIVEPPSRSRPSIRPRTHPAALSRPDLPRRDAPSSFRADAEAPCAPSSPSVK